MKIALIYWDKSSKNYGREGDLFKDGDKEKNELSVNLYKGWWKSQPISVVEMTKDEVAAAVTARQAEWDALKASELEHVFDLGDKKITVVPAEMQLAFENTYTDKGKIIPPKYSAVFAFRRGSALLGAIALRMKLKLGDLDEVTLVTNSKGDVSEKGLPVNVEHYANEYERVEACAMENFGKSQGLSEVDSDWPTIMKVAREMRDFYRKVKGVPITESRLTDVFKKGSGAKAFYLTQLDTKYPALKIIDNVIANKTPGGGLDRETLRKLRDDDKTTEIVLATYLADPKKAKKNAVKPITYKDLETFAKETPSVALKFILRAICAGDKANLFAFYASAVKVDAAAAPYIEYCRAQLALKESMEAKGESQPPLTEEALPEEAPPAVEKVA